MVPPLRRRGVRVRVNDDGWLATVTLFAVVRWPATEKAELVESEPAMVRTSGTSAAIAVRSLWSSMGSRIS